jgi:hypothetical protein
MKNGQNKIQSIDLMPRTTGFLGHSLQRGKQKFLQWRLLGYKKMQNFAKNSRNKFFLGQNCTRKRNSQKNAIKNSWGLFRRKRLKNFKKVIE